MKKKTIMSLLAAMAISAMSVSGQVTTYTNDFESYNVAANGDTSLQDGWLVGANVWNDSAKTSYAYGYFAFPAPNNLDAGPAFSNVVTGEGGIAQGDRQLVAFSDYNNSDHANGKTIESNLFRDIGVIGAGQVGETWQFSFDVKQGNIIAPSVAYAAIKVIKTSDSSFATLANQTVDTSATGTNWSTLSTSLTFDAAWVGETLQIAFINDATAYNPSGVFYDNITVSQVPEPATIALLTGAAALGLVMYRRRKAANS